MLEQFNKCSFLLGLLGECMCYMSNSPSYSMKVFCEMKLCNKSTFEAFKDSSRDRQIPEHNFGLGLSDQTRQASKCMTAVLLN